MERFSGRVDSCEHVLLSYIAARVGRDEHIGVGGEAFVVVDRGMRLLVGVRKRCFCVVSSYGMMQRRYCAAAAVDAAVPSLSVRLYKISNSLFAKGRPTALIFSAPPPLSRRVWFSRFR